MKPYAIVWDEIVHYMLRDFEGDFEGALRHRLPTLEDAKRIVPLERDPWRFDVEVEAVDRTWDVVSLLEGQANRLVVLGAYPRSSSIPREHANRRWHRLRPSSRMALRKECPGPSTSIASGMSGKVCCLVTDAMLDTTFFIDLRNGDSGAEDPWNALKSGTISAAYSTMTVFELWVGRDFDSRREEFYLDIFGFLEEVRLSRSAAIQAAAWLRQFPREARNTWFRDALIAASALERNEAMRTRNVRDFARFPGLHVETY